MALVTLRDVLNIKVENNYAVGAFGTTDYLIAEAIIRAAEEKGTPVILMVGSLINNPIAEHLIPYLADRSKKAVVPVVLHLDHGKSIDVVEKAIRYGCSSVMFDASALPIDENIALTNKVIEIASKYGVSVEGEIGDVPGPKENEIYGIPDENRYTEPEDAVRYVRETGIDALAIAIGTVHGLFKEKPKLDFHRLAEINRKVNVPLVLHGATGLTEQDIDKAIQLGIKKINVFTGLMLAAGYAAGELFNKQKRYSLMAQAAFDAAVEYIKQQISIFNTPTV